MTDSMQDRLEIRELAWAFSAGAGALDATRLSKTFTDDAILAGVAKLVGMGDIDIVGAKAIDGFFAPLFASLEFVHHTSQVVDLEVSGDRAKGKTMIIEWARTKDGQKLMQVMGTYTDDIIRTDKGWRFTRRELAAKSFSFLAEIPG